ncbi:MAG: DUF4923 family protein [Prevotella sp.]|nr:DUF4923 family protein [Prevotella sp.]
MKSIQKLMMVMLLAAVVNTAYAQDIETVVDSVKSNLKNDDFKEAVSNIKDAFKIKEATVEMMVGKWRYVEPAVYATKGNVLIKLIGNTVANQLEKILDDYIEKCHITPKNTMFTFYKNGTFLRNVVGHKAQGVWMVGREKLILGINKILTAEITTHHDGNKLMFLIDVDKLMNIFKLLGAIEDNKTNETLIKLMKKIPTLQAGFSFEKVK